MIACIKINNKKRNYPMKHVTFLTALCITSYSIHAMDKPKYVTPQAMIIHAKQVQALDVATHSMLINFNQSSKKTRKELIEIIDRMKSLKLAQPPIKEKEIGFFCYKEKTDSISDSVNKTLFGSLPMSLAKSIFFARLTQYNNDLEKKSLISPTEQQVVNYFKNIARHELVLKNAELNITIPQQTITEVTLSIPTNVGIIDFVDLLMDIQGLLNNYSLKESRQTAKLIYHDQLNGK